MLEQLRSLDRKDRRALIAGATVAVAALIWFTLVAPLHKATEQASTRFDGALESHRKIQEIGNTVRESGMHLPDRSWSIDTIESAIAETLEPDTEISIRESGPTRADISINDIDYDQFIELLWAFQQLGLFVEQAEVAPEDKGQTLSVSLTIGR